MKAATDTTCADPALAAVRAQKQDRDDAEVGLLRRVIEWAVEHTTDEDPDAVTYGDRPLPLGGTGCPVISEFAAYDLAAALGMTSDSGTRYLARALEIRYRLPKIWAAVLTGRLPVWKAGRVAEATMVLSQAGAAYVDSRLGQAVARISFAQVERLVEEALARFDPVELEARRVKAAESRRVIIDLTDTSIEGTTNLYATLDLADATDLDDALRAAATALAAAGSTESLDVRRSIALGDLARGQSSLEFSTAGAGRELVVHLHHDSPHVARCETTRAPITVEQIKTWCATSTTKITIKPVIDLNAHIHVDAYEVPDRLRTQTELINLTCVFPHCTKPATRCDTDHITPHAAGGETASDNIAPLCRRHHRAKTHSRWRYRTPSPGTYLWTTPAGLTYQRDHTGTTPLDDPTDH